MQTIEDRTVVVTEEIISLAREIAEIRVSCKPIEVDLNKDNFCGVEPEEIHFIGAVGELCYSKFAYGKLVADKSRRPLGDDCDFKTKSGKLVDVKTSTWQGENVYLKVKMRALRDKPKDYYVLAHYLKPWSKVIIVGYATKGMVADASLRDFGNGDMLSILGCNLVDSVYAKGRE